MLVQQKLIARVRELCVQDGRLVAALMYGSFAKGAGDEYSDIEFVLFFKDETLPDLDTREWLTQIAPVELCFVNEFGTTVAIFDNLVRGEFHFDKISEVEAVTSWGDTVKFPTLESTLVVDKTGQLTPHLFKIIGPPSTHTVAEQGQFVIDAFFNWFIFGFNVLQRGEYAHAHGLLWWIQRYLIQMVRLLEEKTINWHTPAKALETEISEAAYKRYNLCASDLNPTLLANAYFNIWQWAVDLIETLTKQGDVLVSASLLKKVDGLVTGSCETSIDTTDARSL